MMSSCVLQDAFGGVMIDVDMLSEDSLELTNPAFNLLKLKVTPNDYSPPEDPSISITSPADSAVLESGDVSVEFLVENLVIPDEGHVHLWVDDSMDGMFFTIDPIAVTGLGEGSHTIALQLVDTGDNAFDPDVLTTVNFTVDTSAACSTANQVELWGECYSIENTTTLNLSASGLTGEIPPEIGNLTNLQKLYLNDNDLSGSIPWDEIINLTDLESLALSYNQLTGQIPSEIGDLTNLQHLSLSNNQLTGSIPWDEIGNLTMLQALSLGANQLTGSIPAEIGNLTNLQELYLDDNQFTGQIPAEIGALINLQWLDLNSNQLTGSIPDDIGNLTNLQKLYLNDNDLSGSIPAAICGLSNMDFSNSSAFWITGNALCPPYPGCVEAYVGNQDCPIECADDQWQCAIGDQCIPESYYCDGSSEHGNASFGPDCADGSDEILATCCNENTTAYVNITDDCGTCDSDPSNDCIEGDNDPDFSVDINVSGDGNTYKLTFGFSPDATDGYDDGIDSYAPPAPPPPEFDAALGWGGDRYYTQILNGSADDLVEHEYDIALAYGSDNLITISWDNTGLGALGDFQLQDAFGGSFIDVNMVDGSGTVNGASATLDTSDPSNSILSLFNTAFNTLKIFMTPSTPVAWSGHWFFWKSNRGLFTLACQFY